MAQQNSKLTEKEQNINTELDFYRQYSKYTDPGDLAYLYKSLPDSLLDLCMLIRSQTIHPFAELARYRDQIPEERTNEGQKYPTVKSILKGLLAYDSSGLIKEREPKDRLIIGCRHNSILLASILKYRGIPSRLRAGHATYLIPNFHTSHTICEVWNEKDKRWMLVDPSTNMIDFSRDKFDFSNDLWIKFQNKEIDPNKYGVPGRYTGLVSIVAKVCSDLACILGTEYPVYKFAPILEYAFQNNQQITSEHNETMNKVSELMNSIDADNITKLQEIYNNHPQIQMTKSFNKNSVRSNKSTSSKSN